MYKRQYINSELESKVKKIASSLNISISKYISTIVERNIEDSWKPKVKNLAGSWSDFSTVEEIRNNSAKDIKRKEL